MKKIDLGQTIQILANIGVLAGIVFLAYEIRQNTQTMQASTFENYTDGALEWDFQLTSNAELARVFSRYLAHDTRLDDAERIQAEMLFRAQWLRFQNAFSQRRREALSAEDWEVAKKLMCVTPDEVGGATREAAKVRRETWALNKPYLNQSFIEFIEGNECWDIKNAVPD